jgi:uncharacterized protein (DUF58 family)
LDLTVRAAAGIADHYLRRGDRVSFVEYGGYSRRLRPSSGHRHFVTSLEWLLDVRSRGGIESPAPLFASNVISPNALVVVLTPLVDERSAEMLARLARSGRVVIAVDTLPPEWLKALDAPVASGLMAGNDFTPIAAKIWRLERANTIDALREHGVPVVAWTNEGSLDEVLRQASRVATSPKAVWR